MERDSERQERYSHERNINQQQERYTPKRRWRPTFSPRSSPMHSLPASDSTAPPQLSVSLTKAATPIERIAAARYTSSPSLHDHDDVPTLSSGYRLGNPLQRFSGTGVTPLNVVQQQEQQARFVTLALLVVAVTFVFISAFLIFNTEVRHPGFGQKIAKQYQIETPTSPPVGTASVSTAHPPTATPKVVGAGNPGNTGTPTLSPISSATATPSANATATATPLPQPKATATPLPQPTATATPLPKPTATATPTPPRTATQCFNNPSSGNCNNVDPTTGNPNCLSPAYNQEQTNVSGDGYFKNWYNTQCLSNWTQAVAWGGNVVLYQVEIESAPHSSVYCNGNSGACDSQAYKLIDLAVNQTNWYTNLVFSPPGTSTRSCVRYDVSGHPTSWYCGAWH